MEGLEIVKQSYGRACLAPHFIDRFYDIFLGSHPSIKPMFKHTDFARQKTTFEDRYCHVALAC